MKPFFLVCAIALVAGCDDTPPSGSQTLSSPTSPVFFKVGSQEYLAFIDQGHDAVRFLDLTVGTYQWGSNPYFPRAVMLDDSPIGLIAQGEALFALSASGQAYQVPMSLDPPASVGLGLPLAPARALALVAVDNALLRLDSDCSLVTLSDRSRQQSTELSACRYLGAGLVDGRATTGDDLYRVSASGLVRLSALPFDLRLARPALDGGYWLLSAGLRRLVRLDSTGQEVRRFVLPYEVMDLVETVDETGPLLNLIGLDRGVVYLREDGTSEAPHGSRVLSRPVPLQGSADGLRISRDLAETLVGRDLLAVGGIELGTVTVHVGSAQGREPNLMLLPAGPDPLPTEALPWVTLSKDELSCLGRLDAEGIFVPETQPCPEGEAVGATFNSSAWHLFAGLALEADANFTLADSLGAVTESAELSLDGHTFTATQAAPSSGAIIGLRGQNGFGSTVLGDGWFSSITAATAKTNYAETEQVWLWLTSPSENAVIQMPVKASEYYSMLIFR